MSSSRSDAERNQANETILSDFAQILELRKTLREKDPEGRGKQLNQGTNLPLISISPYSRWDTGSYVKGLLFGDKASSEKCQEVAPIGKIQNDHCVGVRSGVLRSQPAAPAATRHRQKI